MHEIDADGFTYFSGCIDEFDYPVKRTKYQFPYSYDAFITYRNGKNEEATSTIYSDRLLQWDYTRYNELSLKHFGDTAQIWFNREPEKIEAFLKDWTGDINLKLIFIMEGCNVSNGFPYWRFDFCSKK